MNKFLSMAGIKFMLMIGAAVGGIAAWALDHFETKEHVMSLKESRDREMDHFDKRLDAIDGKLNILIERGR